MAQTQRDEASTTNHGESPDAEVAVRPTTPLTWATWGLSVIGLLLSAYLTYEHFTGNATLSCPATGAINCEKVTTSSWSEVFGIPVAVFGLIFFVVMTVACLPTYWRIRSLDIPRVVATVVGIGSVIYLVWVELFQVNAICLWCTGVHLVTLLLLVAVLWLTAVLRSHDAEATAPRKRPSGRR
jgi:uncharacterized membrane protein